VNHQGVAMVHFSPEEREMSGHNFDRNAEFHLKWIYQVCTCIGLVKQRYFLNTKVVKRVLTLVLVLSLSTGTAFAADIFTETTPKTWGVVASNDGFSSKYTIYKNADNMGYSDAGTEITYFMEFQCEKKILTVLVYSDPLGIYPTTSLSGYGIALGRVDSGKIVKYNYYGMKDNSGISLTAPKVFTTAALKAKQKIAFKIPSSIQADTVANFSIGNLSSYVNKFKNLGCPLK